MVHVHIFIARVEDMGKGEKSWEPLRGKEVPLVLARAQSQTKTLKWCVKLKKKHLTRSHEVLRP